MQAHFPELLTISFNKLGTVLKNIDVIDCLILGRLETLSSVPPEYPCIVLTRKKSDKKKEWVGFCFGLASVEN